MIQHGKCHNGGYRHFTYYSGAQLVWGVRDDGLEEVAFLGPQWEWTSTLREKLEMEL